jgi:glucose/arabinose dehydrogenase
VPTIAPSGLTRLSGAQWQGWDRALAVAVLKGRQLRIFFMTGIYEQDQEGWQIAVTDRGRLRSAVQGPDGNLYISTDNGSMNDQILKVVPS